MSAISDDRTAERSIVIIGFMGAGKTTIGRLLAERLAMQFLDSDREIERAFGLTITEIFAERGEPAFREAERQLIFRLLSGPPTVLSLGGGAYQDGRTREAVNEAATVIWLDPPFELISDRLARSTKRPLASGRSSEELRSLWNERRGSYAQAHVHVVTSDGEPIEAVEQILTALGRD